VKRRCMGLAVQVPAEVALKRPITQPSGQPDAATLSRGSVSRTDRTHFKSSGQVSAPACVPLGLRDGQFSGNRLID
jgi:hypothetical protein